MGKHPKEASELASDPIEAAIMAAGTAAEAELMRQYRRAEWEEAKDLVEGADMCALAVAAAAALLRALPREVQMTHLLWSTDSLRALADAVERAVKGQIAPAAQFSPKRSRP